MEQTGVREDKAVDHDIEQKDGKKGDDDPQEAVAMVQTVADHGKVDIRLLRGLQFKIDLMVSEPIGFREFAL